MLQRSSTSADDVRNVPPIVYDVLRSPGRPLDTGVRAFMESRFGTDFSGVRIHTDVRAAESAAAVNANAYTVGQHVVFNEGRYAPSTADGLRLVAHEVFHTFQQEHAPASKLVVGSTSDPREHEAARSAALAVDSQVLAPALPTADSNILRRQVAGVGGPNTPDQCRSLLDMILALMEEVAQRFNDLLDDRHGLFEHHRSTRDAHPEHGSWEGHQRRYDADRRRLRERVAEWDQDDRCRNYRLTPDEINELIDAREFSGRPAASLPAPSMHFQPSDEDSLKPFLPDWVIPLVIAAGLAALLAACFATGVCEVALAIAGLGAAAAAAILIALDLAGVRDSSSGGPTA